MLKNIVKGLCSASGVALVIGFGAAVLAAPQAEAKVRVAYGDIASVENLHLLAAFELAKQKGVDIEMTYLKSEDIAAQAVVSGQADIGVGGPYALIQKVKVPVRIFLQLSTLRFYPAVNAEFYKTWKDLNGQEVAVHSRGSGTEAIMRLMEQKQGIKFSKISYIPGSEVRTGALLQGNVKATIVDSNGRRLLEQKAPGKFVILPMDGVNATDEALFARQDYLEKNPKDVDIIVESILTTWREVTKNPAVVAEWRAKYKLLPDLPADQVAEITPYFTELAEGKAFPLNGGGAAAAKDDFAFYTLSGQLTGEPASLKVDEFWALEPLNRVLGKVGTN
ncbi:ABC transporter substrate-binding protein [Ancylobacter defluvii]|uniref:Nitrate ABC transporter substrate-binding protein n=1 Tax=Ancylobacter defluvii TaxID=1282440 RepID=A0A9W6ND05_9HYPH|nr:ABC transporter substrate-binding protein [Ancylobacter defluvii]MBS7586911.1 ABC transporter substrate-binding protein [Ancylobacter defluvii]GLK86217.1 nitrate ABC transporter substrate-binding protein [Ancylobacter defluvii]